MQITESRAFLSQQIITCIGNKRALLDFIGGALERIKNELGCEKPAIADLFGGSGIVSRYFKSHAGELFFNDLEGYAHTLALCYLSNSTQRDMSELLRTHRELLHFIGHNMEKGFLSRLYAPQDSQNIHAGERVFYTSRNAMFLDTARGAIEKLPEQIRHFFIAPLISEASIKTNTAGVFKGFYKNSATGAGQFGGNGRHALTRILSEIELPFPVFSLFDCNVHIFRRDANELARELPPVDIVYLDPPYNQHPYGSNYFMLNLINEYREPQKISRVSGIPADWNRSDYNKSALALTRLCELCAAVSAKYLLISFNSEGFISRLDMERALGELGRVSTLEQKYNAFRGSRNLSGRGTHTNEYLYIVKK